MPYGFAKLSRGPSQRADSLREFGSDSAFDEALSPSVDAMTLDDLRAWRLNLRKRLRERFPSSPPGRRHGLHAGSRSRLRRGLADGAAQLKPSTAAHAGRAARRIVLTAPVATSHHARRMSSPAPQATQLHAGDVVAERYLVERLLGRGGMGEVYEALDTKLERRVALKIVVAKASPDARRRLEAEAKAVAALEHPGIVTLHDVLEHGDLVVLVLELVPGTSLRDMIEREPLEPDTVGRIVTGVAQALEAAHARGFLHRDVKPDNVIVRPDGRTVLLDFGIAKGPAGLSPFAMTVTADGALMGTPGYLAPEQIRGEPVTAAVDQFALAVMAYELCTGRLPWNASSVASIIASIVSDSPKRFHDPPSDDDAEIESVFARALDKQPEERYPSVSAFAAALRTALGTTEKDALPRRPITPTEGGVPHAKKDLRTFTGPDASSTDASADASSTDASADASSADASSADASSADELSPEAASLDEHSPDVHSPGGSASKSDVEVLERPIAPRKRVWMGGIALIAIGAVALTTIGTMRRETTPPSLAVSPSSAPSADASSELPDELPASGAPSAVGGGVGRGARAARWVRPRSPTGANGPAFPSPLDVGRGAANGAWAAQRCAPGAHVAAARSFAHR